MTNKGTAYICLYLPRHALTCPPSLLLCKIHDSSMQPNLPKHGCARPTVCIIETKDTLTWDHIAVRNKMVTNVFLNRQFRNNMFHSEIGTRNKTVLDGQFWKQCVPFTDMGTRNKTLLIDQFGNSVFHLQIGSRNKTVLIDQFGNSVFHLQIGSRNKTVLIDQFGNSVFHLQIGTRNKTVLIDQFGNSVFHLQIGTRNKTVLIDQFGNSVFHLQIGTRNKTVLIDQFGNSVLHSQIGTRNEMFLFYTRVNVLFLPCKKVGLLIVNRNTKIRNEERSFFYIGTANKT